MTQDLEQVMEQKVKPILDQAMSKFLGITVPEIKTDITDRIKKSPLIDFLIDTKIPFKLAKEEFKRQYLMMLLRKAYGNVSLAAKHADLDRRSIHRLITKFNIDAEKFRKEMLKPSYLKEVAVNDIIETTLKNYETVLKTEKLEDLYNSLPELSKDVVKQIPSAPLTLKDAEEEFEKKFIQQALTEHNNNISRTAKTIGLRFETLHRKMKSLGV